MGNFLFKVAFVAVCAVALMIALPIIVFSFLILVIGMVAVLIV
jgi:hypothetical protein